MNLTRLNLPAVPVNILPIDRVIASISASVKPINSLAGRRRSKSTLMTATPTNGHFTTPSRRWMNHTISGTVRHQWTEMLTSLSGVPTLFYQLKKMFSIEEGSGPILLFMSVNKSRAVVHFWLWIFEKITYIPHSHRQTTIQIVYVGKYTGVPMMSPGSIF